MTEEASDKQAQPARRRRLWVAKLAADAAVTASKKSGRPLDPRVKKIAETSLEDLTAEAEAGTGIWDSRTTSGS